MMKILMTQLKLKNNKRIKWANEIRKIVNLWNGEGENNYEVVY